MREGEETCTAIGHRTHSSKVIHFYKHMHTCMHLFRKERYAGTEDKFMDFYTI
jgi:hypothetical protein